MDKGQRFKLITNVITLSLTTLLLVFTLFGWYVTNSKAEVHGVTGVSASDSSVSMLDDVTAVRYSLNGDITTNKYKKQSGGKLVLVESTVYTASTNTTETIDEFEETTYFVITEMLPGEHVDITIGYTIDSSKDGKNYEIYLKNIVGDEFKEKVDGKTHYVTGAFRYKNISLKDSNGTDAAGFTADTEYAWFSGYAIDKDDSPALDKVILNHTWDSDYGSLYYTFSIYEDFTQYYRLIAQAEHSYGNLLSQKNFNIGEIYLFLK